MVDLAYFLGLSTGKHRDAEFIADQVQFYYAQLPGEVQANYPLRELRAGLAPAILGHIVRFQYLLLELDLAVPNAAEFVGEVFAKMTNFGIAVGADEWLAK